MHKNIKYGWTNKSGEFREYGDSRMMEEYYFPSPEETVERKSGLCGDQVLLEKMWFDYHKIENHIVQFGFKNDDNKRIGGGHTFLVYVDNGKYYYFENAFAPSANIVEYDNFNELVGTAVAIYLLCTNNTDKVDKIYTILDVPKLGFNKKTGKLVNSQYYDCVVNKLLSEETIEGSKYNGGYIGLVEKKQNGYDITIDKKLSEEEQENLTAIMIIKERKERINQIKNTKQKKGEDR